MFPPIILCDFIDHHLMSWGRISVPKMVQTWWDLVFEIPYSLKLKGVPVTFCRATSYTYTVEKLGIPKG